MKKFIEEFKAFISKGDVVSMAVGLMVGSAFTAIITALNANILTPLLGIIIGGVNFEEIIVKVGAAEIGVGLFIHEEPRLSPKCETVLLPGHAVTVEPGVYLPGLGGCRIEDTVILTESGFIDPMTAPKELIIL